MVDSLVVGNFATHGAQKLLGWFGGLPEGIPAFITYVAGPIELVGGALIAIGLFSRPTCVRLQRSDGRGEP